MKVKVMILSLLIILVVTITACNPQLKNKGVLIYKTSQTIEGEWLQESYPQDSKFVTITPENIDEQRKKLRNITGLSLNNGLAVYITLGEAPTGGYNIQIQEVRKLGEKLIVTSKAVSPAPDQIVTQVITYPYDLVRLSASEVQNITEVIFYTAEGKEIKKEKI